MKRAAARCPAGMVAIPASTFTMGDIDPKVDSKPGEALEHQVTLSAYCIDRTEVTVAAYTACVGDGACTPAGQDDRELKICNFGVDGRGDHPINCVTWPQASAYCAWANARLPTEAEWEFAARGTDERRFPWGNDDPTFDRLNFKQAELNTNQRGTVPVGTFPRGASGFGVFDLAGNVAEWVADWQGYYGTTPVRNPKGPPGTATDAREFRGGSWVDFDPAQLTSSRRIGAVPSTSAGYIGFRCAR